MQEIRLTTKDGDTCFLQSLPMGIKLYVIPQKPPLEPGIFDTFSLGLRITSIVRALYCLRYREQYDTEDGLASLRMRDGEITLRFSFSHHPEQSFFCHFSIADSKELLSFLDRSVSGKSLAGYRTSSATVRRTRVGRNEPCPCGSGKKYKRCCMNKAADGTIPEELAPYREVSDIAVQEALAMAAENRAVLSDPEFWCDLGAVLGTVNEPDKANSCFAKALSIDRNCFKATVNWAATLHTQGKTEEALRKIEEVPAGKFRREIIKVNILQAQGRHIEAIALYEQAIEQEPDFHLPYARLLVSLQETNHPLFEYWLEKSVAAVPESPHVAHIYCYHLLRQNRLQELLDADWIDTLESGAGQMDVIGRNAEDPFLIVEAQLFRAAAVIAETHSQKALEEAISILTAADPNWHLCDVAKLLSAAAANLGKPGLIEISYGRVCPVCRTNGIGIPRFVESLVARAHLNTGNLEDALRYCERVLERDPDCEVSLWDYWWGLDELGQTQEAISIAKKLYDINSRIPHITYNLGYLCGKTGQLGDAIHYYEQQVQKQPRHRMAYENLSFIYLLAKNEKKASECFEQFVDQVTAEVIESTQDVTKFDEDTEGGVTLTEFVSAKRRKFDKLVEFCRVSKNSASFSLDLVEVNHTSEPILGAEVSIGTTKYSVEDLLNCVRRPNGHSEWEVRFQLEMEQSGDYSVIFRILRAHIPGFQRLPDEAKISLVEGQRAVNERSRDYSPAVVMLAKAVEVTLKQLIFDPYMQACRVECDIEREIKIAFSDKSAAQVQNFLKFIEKGQHFELGSMAHVLKLCNGSLGKRMFLVKKLRDFIVEDLKIVELLGNDTVQKIEILAEHYRNPAAHATIFDRNKAEEARAIALEILKTF